MSGDRRILIASPDERAAQEVVRIAQLIRDEYPKLSDEEIMVYLWRRLGQRNDELSRIRYPDTTGQ